MPKADSEKIENGNKLQKAGWGLNKNQTKTKPNMKQPKSRHTRTQNSDLKLHSQEFPFPDNNYTILS